MNEDIVILNLPPNVMREECCIGFNRSKRKFPALLSHFATILDCQLVDSNIQNWDLFPEVFNFLKSRRPNYIICSVSKKFEHMESKIFEICKDLRIKCVVIPIPFVYAYDFVRHYDFHFAIYSEPEKTLKDWHDGTDLENLKGIIYRKGDKIIKNPAQDKWFRNVPPISFSKFQLSSYNVFVYQIGRGCPYRCGFCSWAKETFQLKSVKTVLQDLEELEKYGVKMAYLLCSQITTNKKWLKEFCSFKIKKGIRMLWTTDIRANELTLDLAMLMREAGCVKVFMGIESVSNTLLRKLKKDLNRSQIIDALNICHQAGLLVNVPFMFNIGENKNDVDDYIDFIRRFSFTTVGTTNIKIHPETAFTNNFKVVESGLANAFKKEIRRQSIIRLCRRILWLLKNRNARSNLIDIIKTWKREVWVRFGKMIILGDIL